MWNQRLSRSFPTDLSEPPGQKESPAPSANGYRAKTKTAKPDHSHLSAELQALAGAVRRIGDGFRDDPETVAIAKETISERLLRLARKVEGGGR